MRKPKFDLWPLIFAVTMVMTLGVTLGSSSAQARLRPDKRSRLIPPVRPVNYVVPTPRFRAQKYIYQVETNQLKQQSKNRSAALSSRKNRLASSESSTVRLKAKMNKKRSVARSSRENRLASSETPSVRLKVKMNKKRSVASE